MARVGATQEFEVARVGAAPKFGFGRMKAPKQEEQGPEVGREVAMRFLDKFPASLSTLNLLQFDWRTNSFSTDLEPERRIESLADLYSFDDGASVGRFLRENSFLLTLLMEARKKIQEYFGPNVEVELELFTDPEADDVQQLFALIHTSLPLEEEANFLENLYDEWWLDALPAAQGKLVVSAE